MTGNSKDKGIVLINKPRGMTSFGVVSRLRRLTGIRKIGHCGTLDPFAQGLLPVCIGRATAAVQFMDGYDKTYHVKIVFGRATDTMDIEGQTIAERIFTKDEINLLKDSDYCMLRAAVSRLAGIRQQTPPMYSAVKISGKPLYSYAREGKTVERKSRKITIYSAEITDICCDADSLCFSASIRISCSKGTYIRVIADELGRELGCYAYAAELTREKCGPYKIEQASDIEDLFDLSRQLPDQSSFVRLIRDNQILLPMVTAFIDLPEIHLDKDQARRFINGQRLLLSDVTEEETETEQSNVLAVFYHKELIAAASIVMDEYNVKQLKTERVFVDIEDFQSI